MTAPIAKVIVPVAAVQADIAVKIHDPGHFLQRVGIGSAGRAAHAVILQPRPYRVDALASRPTWQAAGYDGGEYGRIVFVGDQGLLKEIHRHPAPRNILRSLHWREFGDELLSQPAPRTNQIPNMSICVLCPRVDIDQFITPRYITAVRAARPAWLQRGVNARLVEDYREWMPPIRRQYEAAKRRSPRQLDILAPQPMAVRRLNPTRPADIDGAHKVETSRHLPDQLAIWRSVQTRIRLHAPEAVHAQAVGIERRFFQDRARESRHHIQAVGAVRCRHNCSQTRFSRCARTGIIGHLAIQSLRVRPGQDTQGDHHQRDQSARHKCLLHVERPIITQPPMCLWHRRQRCG